MGKLCAELKTREPDGILRPDELAETVGIGEAEVRTLMSLAAEAGVVEEARFRRCPSCDARTEEGQLLEQLAKDEVVECAACGDEFTELTRWRRGELIYRFTAVAAEEVAAAQAAEAAKPEATAVVLCALPLERDAVLAHFDDLDERVHDEGTVYKTALLRGRHVNWTVATAVIGPHNEGAASETERVATFLSPDVVIFCGVAGGIAAQGVELGDVIVAEEAVAYMAGKEKDSGFESRARVARAAWPLVQRALNELAAQEWRDRIKVPDTGRRHAEVGLIAAGPRVVATTEGESYEILAAHYPKALAVEMEGYGVLDALQKVRNTDGIVVRGISDLLAGKGKTDSEGWQPRAAANAAAFALHLLYTLTPPKTAV